MKSEAEVTVTVHCVIRCTNFVPDSDSHLDHAKGTTLLLWPLQVTPAA